MAKSKVLKKEITSSDELDEAILDLLDEIDEEYSEEIVISEEEKTKRKSIWNKISD